MKTLPITKQAAQQLDIMQADELLAEIGWSLIGPAGIDARMGATVWHCEGPTCDAILTVPQIQDLLTQNRP